jgi:thiosulfate dehydrogenase
MLKKSSKPLNRVPFMQTNPQRKQPSGNTVGWLKGLLCQVSLASGLLIGAHDQALPQEIPGLSLPAALPGQYLHQTPDIDQLREDTAMHPQLRALILRGYALFTDTQQLRGSHVFNDMNCKSCHLGAGGLNWAGPVWPAATTLPDYRGKNQRINTLEDRIADCFAYSMNGTPPASGSEDMLALTAYHQWLATGAPMYEQNIAGRGFGHLGNRMPENTSIEQGRQLYEQHCSLCHGADGSGIKQAEQVVFPALWGDGSYNWGAGMSRVPTAASFIHLNMPLGKPGSLSEQEAWDLALFINSQERPQDPRFTGNAQETRERYLDFHQLTQYGLEVDGRILGQGSSTGLKPFLKPDNIELRE